MNTQVYELYSLNPRLWVPLRNNNYHASPCKCMEYILTRNGLWSSSWITLIQSASSHSDFVNCISTFTSHLGAGLVDSFLQIFQTKPSTCLYSLTHAVCFELDLPDNIWQVQFMNLRFCSFFPLSFYYSLFCPNIFFGTLKTLSNIRECLCSHKTVEETEPFKRICKFAKSDY